MSDQEEERQLTKRPPLTCGGGDAENVGVPEHENSNQKKGKKGKNKKGFMAENALTAEAKLERSTPHWFTVDSRRGESEGMATPSGRITGCGQPSPARLQDFLFKEMGATCIVTLQKSSEGITAPDVVAQWKEKKKSEKQKPLPTKKKKKKEKEHRPGKVGEEEEEEKEEGNENSDEAKEDLQAGEETDVGAPATTAPEGKVELIGKTCADHGKVWLHLPLSGANLGEVQTDYESLKKLAQVADLVQQGHSVVLHCAAGMHRTGASLYIVLRLSGYSSEEAVQAVKQIRGVTHEELLKSRKKIGMPLVEKAEGLFQQLFVTGKMEVSSSLGATLDK